MKRILTPLTAAFLCALAFTAEAAHTRATLILSATTAKPGETITAGVRLQMEPGWHTYWKNPGASGEATEIKWQLPVGVSAGEIEWPLPEKFLAEELTTYIYHDEVVLLVPLKLASGLKSGPLEMKAKVSWLECEQLCVRGNANITAKLEIGEVSQPSSDVSLVETWKNKLPRPAEGLGARAWWETSDSGTVRPLILEWDAPASIKEVDFFPYTADNFEVQPAVENLSDTLGKVRLRKLVKKFEGDWPKRINGVLIQKTAGEPQGFVVDLAVGSTGGATLPVSSSPPAASAPAAKSLGLMLLYAFVGGLILNVMPCVFPVIALKILGFVQQSHDEPRRVFALGLIYGLGVLASFLLMAGVIIAIQQAGGSAGWGIQFKSPQISVGFIALVVLIALNLFGVFEVNPGGRTMAAASQLASRHGAAGAFFNGVLATVLATPCTAPVLASALGFAFTKPPLVIMIFFLTIGLGLAFPYVLLSWKPGWLKFLPRPGRWMERFKVAMGFPMLATAVWMFWFTAPRFGEDGVIWIGFFLIGLAFGVWIWGEFVQRASKRRVLAMLISLGMIFVSYVYALKDQLHWRSPASSSAASELQNEREGVQWQPWSTNAVARARSAGRPVLVDFTAKWCLTCNTLVKPAVDNRKVRRKLDDINGVALLADYTDYPDEMTAELRKFHRDAAVPLVLVYPRDVRQPPVVLPTIPTRKDVLDALAKAAQ